MNPAANQPDESTKESIYGDSLSPLAESVQSRDLRAASYSSSSLSTEQILGLMQQQPDILIELKSFIASLADQQGRPNASDAISDESLYAKIASSPTLRANITTFLRARGYTTDVEQQPYLSSAEESDTPLQIQSNDTQAPLDIPRSDARVGSVDADQSLFRAGSETRSSSGPKSLGLLSTSLRANDVEKTATSEPEVLHRPAPYNLLVMRDLYTQVPVPNSRLKRFGSEVFLHRESSSRNQIAPGSRETPLDVPSGASYIVGPGDTLSISLWGGTSQSLTRVIDREGRITLPESGVLSVGGLTLERAEAAIAQALKQQYRDVQASVTIARLRSIRIYVVGDVQRPGAYDISSLSTSLSALYAAGGPTAVGSLRVLQHYRGKQLIGEIDLYDFLLHGIQTEDRLHAGDTLLVPPAGPQVSIYGAVKRPAIYELKESSSLASVLEDAGGSTVAAELGHIVIDRIGANHQRETVSLDLDGKNAQAAIASFSVHDGDRIHVAPILPYSQRVIYLEGHVARPGRIAYRDGMKLSDVLSSYRELLPEPADNGEIIRLIPPDLHPEAMQFNVPEALIGNDNQILQPFDTIRIHGRYEADAPRVTIDGEVLRPGIYALPIGMTAAQLVRMAGGFKRDALLESADLTSYQIVNGAKVVSARTSIQIGDAVLHSVSASDIPLKPGDVLTVHQITGWNDIGSSITIEGEVAHPGSYGIQPGERLSSILRRAGGLRETSYPAGAILLREEVRRLEEKSRQELIRQIESSSAAARTRPDLTSSDQSASIQLIAQQQEQVLSRLKNQPASGRLIIHIDSDISTWENTSADIEVRAGDTLRIPKKPGFVLVSGQVYNASAITFAPDQTAGWYLRRAGGATEIANKKEIFIIRANGSVVGRGSGSWLGRDVLSTHLDPGDVVVVPQKIMGPSLFWRNLLTVAQITSSIAITAAVAGVI